MKLFKCLAVASAAVILLSSCSVLQGSRNDAKSTGSNTGSALVSLYKILTGSGSLDLSDLTTLINIGKVLIGANSLTGATEAFSDQFASGLISGSSSLINSSNVNGIMDGLRALTKVDTSVLTQAATAAANGNAMQVNTANAGVASTVSSLTNILQLMN